MKLKTSFALILFSISIIGLADDLVRLDADFNSFTINGTTNKTIALNFDKPTQQPTDEANAPKVYVPMQRTAANSKLYYLYNIGGTTEIFNKDDTANVVNFPLRVFAGASNKYLYAAVFDTDSEETLKWEIIKAYPGNPVVNLSNTAVTFPVSPADICAQTGCTNLELLSTSEVAKNFKVYFFLSTDSNLSKSTQIDPTAVGFNNGIYFAVGLSNKVLDATDYSGTITGVRRGDRRLFLEYTTTGTVVSDMLDMRVISHPAKDTSGADNDVNDFPGGQAIGHASYANSSVLPDSFKYSPDGELNVRNLENGTDYIFAFVSVNKYLFASIVSNAEKERPAEIEELLAKNSCFLLTAGFGEDHYIIDYFRHFRDQVLLKSFFGKKFVNVYYEMAPKYALIIYENEFLRSVIRGAAYILYFAFTHIYLMLLAAVLIPTYFVWSYTLRKIKTLKT